MYACCSSHPRPNAGSTIHLEVSSSAQLLTLLNPALLAGITPQRGQDTSLPFLTFSTGSVNRLWFDFLALNFVSFQNHSELQTWHHAPLPNVRKLPIKPHLPPRKPCSTGRSWTAVVCWRIFMQGGPDNKNPERKSFGLMSVAAWTHCFRESESLLSAWITSREGQWPLTFQYFSLWEEQQLPTAIPLWLLATSWRCAVHSRMFPLANLQSREQWSILLSTLVGLIKFKVKVTSDSFLTHKTRGLDQVIFKGFSSS